MDDELEDRIFYQSYLTHMKLMSKFLVGLPLNSSYLGHVWKMLRLYVLKPEVLFIGGLFIVVFIYIQALEVWSKSLLTKLRISLGRSAQARIQKAHLFTGDLENTSWDFKEENVAVYAVQGRRPRMEDRFVVNEDINDTGVSLFAVFDGHGGEVSNFLLPRINKCSDTMHRRVGDYLIWLIEYMVIAVPWALFDFFLVPTY